MITLYHELPSCKDPEEGLGKHCGHRRKYYQSAFSPFPRMFSILSKQITILDTLILSSAIAFKLVKSKVPSFGKGLIDGKSSTAKSTCQSR